jgi:Tfp pilus assembly protein PilN
MMRALDLDFVAGNRRGRWLGIGLLAIAAIATAKLADMYAESQREVEQIEARIASIERRANGISSDAPKLADATIQEIRRANQVIDQITLPWDRLFRAVESVANGRVALLGITPDQAGGTVALSAEAADVEAMFDYVKGLQRAPSLARVYLLNHQVNARDPQRPVRFTVTASWMEKNSS